VDLRADQLCFTLDEIAVFLRQVMGLRLSADDVAAMEARTEGGSPACNWPPFPCRAVKTFTALSRRSPAAIITSWTIWSNRCSSFNPRRCAHSCCRRPFLIACVGRYATRSFKQMPAEPMDGQAMLEALDQMSLFVIPLDDERRWYRYHHLFADVLNRHLEHQFPYQLPELHRRASQWYEQTTSSRRPFSTP